MASSIHHVHRKPANTPENRSRPAQLALALMGEVPGLYTLEPWAVERIDLDGALQFCVLHDGRTAKAIGRAMGETTSKGYMSKLLNGLWREQWSRLMSFVRETNCAAPFQIMVADMRRMGYDPAAGLTRQIAALEARIVFLTAQIEQQRRSAA